MQCRYIYTCVYLRPGCFTNKQQFYQQRASASASHIQLNRSSNKHTQNTCSYCIKCTFCLMISKLASKSPTHTNTSIKAGLALSVGVTTYLKHIHIHNRTQTPTYSNCVFLIEGSMLCVTCNVYICKTTRRHSHLTCPM